MASSRCGFAGFGVAGRIKCLDTSRLGLLGTTGDGTVASAITHRQTSIASGRVRCFRTDCDAIATRPFDTRPATQGKTSDIRVTVLLGHQRFWR
jgi:hypothetical protein